MIFFNCERGQENQCKPFENIEENLLFFHRRRLKSVIKLIKKSISFFVPVSWCNWFRQAEAFKVKVFVFKPESKREKE